MFLLEFLFYMVFVTWISGGIGYLVWCIFSRILGEREPLVCYKALKLVCLFLFLPICYFAVIKFNTGLILSPDSFWSNQFTNTRVMTKIMHIIIIIWMITVVVSIFKKIIGFIKWKKILKENQVCTEYDEVADYVKQMLGLKKNIRIYVNKKMNVPAIYGISCPTVLLPAVSYTREEIRMILFHEFCHYKNKDLHWKYFTDTILTFHQMNPFASFVLKSVDRWGEICCDLTVNEYGKSYFTPKEYFTMILSQIENRQKEQRLWNGSSALFEKRSNLEERMRVAKKQLRHKSGRIGAFVAGILFLAVFLPSTYLSGAGVKAASEIVYFKTEEIVDISDEYVPYVPETYIEEVEGMEADEGYEVIEMPDSTKDKEGDATWSVPGKSIVKSIAFPMKKGENLKLNVIVEPDTQNVRVGYQEGKNAAVTILDNKIISHVFTVPKSGTYRIYVKNLGEEELIVSMVYVRSGIKEGNAAESDGDGTFIWVTDQKIEDAEKLAERIQKISLKEYGYAVPRILFQQMPSEEICDYVKELWDKKEEIGAITTQSKDVVKQLKDEDLIPHFYDLKDEKDLKLLDSESNVAWKPQSSALQEVGRYLVYPMGDSDCYDAAVSIPLTYWEVYKE